MVERKKWRSNFSPQSSSEIISQELFKEPDFDQMKMEDLENWLYEFREREGYEMIDVMQLRDMARWASRTYVEAVRPKYQRLCQLAEQLMMDRSIVVPMNWGTEIE